MREKKFRGFDDIHCPQSWKKQVIDQLKSSERKKRVYIWRIAVLFLLALLSLGTAYACSDTVRDWLSSLFSNGQEKVQVKEDPVSVQALNGITYLDADCRYYVKLPEEKIAGEDTLTVYEKGRIVEDAVSKKSIKLQLPVENSTVTVQLQYVYLKDEYLPLYLKGEEGDGIPDSSFRVLADGMLVIEYVQDTFQNAYLVDPETADVQTIGDLSYAYHAEAESGMHIYANTVQSSVSGRFLLYRTYALAQGWAKEKAEAQWVLLDRVENTRRRLDTKRLPGYLLGNELRMAGDTHIITTKSYAVDATTEANYPIVYNYRKNTWTEYSDYQCAVPFVSDYLYRARDSSMELLNFCTQEKHSIPLPENMRAEDCILYPYDGFYISESTLSSALDIYIVSQQRWIHLDAKILNGETAVLFAYPLDDHTLLLNQTYLIEFHK